MDYNSADPLILVQDEHFSAMKRPIALVAALK
jgi:hypothetical protein